MIANEREAEQAVARPLARRQASRFRGSVGDRIPKVVLLQILGAMLRLRQIAARSDRHRALTPAAPHRCCERRECISKDWPTRPHSRGLSRRYVRSSSTASAVAAEREAARGPKNIRISGRSFDRGAQVSDFLIRPVRELQAPRRGCVATRACGGPTGPSTVCRASGRSDIPHSAVRRDAKQNHRTREREPRSLGTRDPANSTARPLATSAISGRYIRRSAPTSVETRHDARRRRDAQENHAPRNPIAGPADERDDCRNDQARPRR